LLTYQVSDDTREGSAERVSLQHLRTSATILIGDVVA